MSQDKSGALKIIKMKGKVAQQKVKDFREQIKVLKKEIEYQQEEYLKEVQEVLQEGSQVFFHEKGKMVQGKVERVFWLLGDAVIQVEVKYADVDMVYHVPLDWISSVSV